VGSTRTLLAAAITTCWIALGVSSPALGESLKVTTPGSESIRQALTITVSGVADGAHSLYVYAEEDRSSCAPNPAEEYDEGRSLVVLSEPEGDPLPSGSFAKTYTHTYPHELPVFCAYLDDTPFDTPDVFATEADLVKEYGEHAEESQPTGSGTSTLPGAIEPAPVNLQLEKEFREHIASEEAERRVRAQEAQSKGQPQPAPCVVPSLRGRSLSAAKRSLRGAHCALGNVTMPARAKHRTLVVIRQGQPPGAKLPGGATVRITLAAPRR
jgi:hypothetical protein